jgi:hypothetical protein
MPAGTLLAALHLASEPPVRVQLQWLSLDRARDSPGVLHPSPGSLTIPVMPPQP